MREPQPAAGTSAKISDIVLKGKCGPVQSDRLKSNTNCGIALICFKEHKHQLVATFLKHSIIFISRCTRSIFLNECSGSHRNDRFSRHHGYTFNRRSRYSDQVTGNHGEHSRASATCCPSGSNSAPAYNADHGRRYLVLALRQYDCEKIGLSGDQISMILFALPTSFP